MKLHTLFALSGVVCLFLSGCSTTSLAYYNTLKLALKDRTVSYTVEEIAASKADLMQIKAGGRDAASLALAYIDGEKYRWVSGDKVIFTMHHGIIVKTEGLDHDLYYTGNLQHNPLATNNVLPFNWKRKVDIASIGCGVPVDSSWRIEGEETREYLGFSVPVIKVIETVEFSEYTPFIDVGLSWENTYFLHKYSKELLASKQQFSPEGDVYDMVYLSRVVREMKTQGATQ
ncbi:YjbF family lipoprotein [Alteromonas macleodii]|uniref:YjbF family lipoprotein n=1 Tax=Alteromonas sp. BZK5 TaxID=1904459 RepID=UPI001653D29D|nr:YjbF family lipoprotein [Alteromonas sp. BZK5]MBC6984470.1 YjbF family lipoprotein [Alteromonas sp. BZK5]MEC7634086.1 YjbF family lipoprotein [Pseudomonadota bacterium]MEE3028918.1 YjbF family lipoprotein [Pseudomonadota bacterium]